MQSAVIVLLKLLLATVTANTNIPPPAQGDSGIGTHRSLTIPLMLTLHIDEVPALGLEETDVARHREITSKAVSAILILTLKWFKTSRRWCLRSKTPFYI